MNRKGFALTETLVVVVFLVTIFTFIYVSVIPLMGKYEDMISSENDIDIYYKLYHIRKMIMSDSNRNTLTNNKNEPVKEIRCENLDINNQAFCIELMKQMELNNNYVIIYTNSIDNLSSIRSINDEIADYIEKHENEIENDSSKITNKMLFLLDTKKHAIAYLYYDDVI